MKPAALRTRLIGATILWLIVALVGGGLALSFAFRRTVEHAFAAQVDSLLLAVIAAIEVPPDRPTHLARSIPDSRFERAYSGWYWQVVDGQTALRSRSLWDATLGLETMAGSDGRGEINGPRGERLQVVRRALQFPSREQAIVAAVAVPEAELRDEINAFNRLLFISLTVLAAGLAGAVALQVGYGLRPLRRLASDLEKVRGGEITHLAGDHPREIDALVHAMNDVLDHDRSRIERARTNVGNLAHGLKTPLSIVAVEAARQPPDGHRIAEQVTTMSRLIDHHLTRAAAAGSWKVLGARTDVAPVVDAIRQTLLRLHAARAVSIEMALAPGLTFAGERQDLEELLGNLLDNACKWAASRVTIRADRDGRQLHVEVEDDGPGLTDEEANIALARGARLDPSEQGSGLGLSIAADLADLYGGTLRIARGTAGGLIVRLVLPAA